MLTKKKNKISLSITDIPSIANTMAGVMATLAIGGEVLRVIKKQQDLEQIKDGIAYYCRKGNLKKVIEGYLRYALIYFFE
jgi:hypothetical protein